MVRERSAKPEEQVKRSFIHYETLGMALEADRILLETYQLDAQQFCEPLALVSKEKAQEALLAFLNLADRDDAAVVGYINEFGEFDHLELDEDRFVGSGIPRSIQRFCKEYVKKGQDPFAVSLNHFWSLRDEIEGLWNLALAVDQKDSQKAREECARRRPKSIFDPEPNWLALGKAILCADLSTALNPGQLDPRLILSEKDGKLVALTMGKTVRSGLYLMLLDKIVSKTAYKKCPNCNKRFIVTVKRKQYCTDVCQNAAKVRRFRVRHRGDASSLGKRTTRALNNQDPEMQLAELREYAGRRGWQIVEEFTDQGVSGCRQSRPALNRRGPWR